MKLSSLKKFAASFCAAAAICAILIGIVPGVMYAAATEQVVYVSLPWLASMSSFIVGTTMRIQSVSVWSASGELRVPRSPPKDSIIIALYPLDASRLGLVPGDAGLFLLYENLPIEISSRGMLAFNPSALPFLSQRMLKVLCELNPDNYSFYQRRMAEFQSRLESAVEVGRSLLNDIPILDLTGAVSPWLRAASTKVVRPPDELWRAWIGNTRTPDLALAVNEAESRGWWILMDAWTPAQVKTRVSSPARLISIPPPETEYDFFTYLHGIYTDMDEHFRQIRRSG